MVPKKRGYSLLAGLPVYSRECAVDKDFCWRLNEREEGMERYSDSASLRNQCDIRREQKTYNYFNNAYIFPTVRYVDWMGKQQSLKVWFSWASRELISEDN